MKARLLAAGFAILLPVAAFAQAAPGEAPNTSCGGSSANQTVNNDCSHNNVGVLVPLNTPLTYVSVSIGTSSTLALAAAPTGVRYKLQLWNPSGRAPSTVATDVYCAFGVPAVIGVGQPVFGGGGGYENAPGDVLDNRAVNCIAQGAAVSITIGYAQR